MRSSRNMKPNNKNASYTLGGFFYCEFYWRLCGCDGTLSFSVTEPLSFLSFWALWTFLRDQLSLTSIFSGTLGFPAWPNISHYDIFGHFGLPSVTNYLSLRYIRALWAFQRDQLSLATTHKGILNPSEFPYPRFLLHFGHVDSRHASYFSTIKEGHPHLT